MQHKFSRSQVEKAARLACLSLTEDEIERFTLQLGEVLSYMEKLKKLHTEGVDPLSHVLPLKGALRNDAPGSSLGTELALREAPRSLDGFFQVPGFSGQGETQ